MIPVLAPALVLILVRPPVLAPAVVTSPFLIPVEPSHRVGVFLNLGGLVVGGDDHVAVGIGSANRPAGEFVALMRGSSGELPGEGTYPAAPAHEGYEFTGWTVGAPDANGNVTITANYKPIEVEEETFTVTFVDGLTGETIEVRTGLVELPGEGTYPAAPAHEG